MQVRALVLPLALLAATAGCGGESKSQDPATRPDVLVLLIDTLRADRLGSYGYERPTSPNLDALARSGAVFRSASAQAPWTIPSVSSIFTGRYLTAKTEHPAPDAQTMAEAFAASGYRTLGLCANFVIMPEVGFGRGFDEFIPRSYLNEKGRRQKRNPGDFETVLDWLDEGLVRATAPDENGERPPLFLYLHPVDPHAPYEKLQRYEEFLPPGSTPPAGPKGWMRETLATYGAPAPVEDPGWRSGLRFIRDQRNRYDREVRFTDEIYGRLLERLRELGVGDKLITAVISDHGEELWEHLAPLTPQQLENAPPHIFFYQSHGYLMTEQALRTPFLLAGPGVPPGLVIDEAVENVDLYPTLMELCGIEPETDLHGFSLVPLMEGKIDRSGWRSETYAFVEQAMVIRDEESGLKLILPTKMGASKGFVPELYDLENDPAELTNIATQRVEDVQRLSSRLAAYLERYPSEEYTVDGAQAEDLLDLLNEFGYGGDMIRAGANEDE